MCPNLNFISDPLYFFSIWYMNLSSARDVWMTETLYSIWLDMQICTYIQALDLQGYRRLYRRYTQWLPCSLDFPIGIWAICHSFGCPSQDHDAKIAVVLALFVAKMLFCLKMSRGMGIFPLHVSNQISPL